MSVMSVIRELHAVFAGTEDHTDMSKKSAEGCARGGGKETDLNGKSPTSPTSPTSSLRLIRRVQGRVGSLRLYEHPRLGLAEVVETHEGQTQLLELHRYTKDMLPDLMAYADEVEQNVTSNVKRPKPKRARPRRLGQMHRREKRKAGGGA